MAVMSSSAGSPAPTGATAALSPLTLAEIASQPACWRQAVEVAGAVGQQLLAPGQRTLVIGCGTSAFVAASWAVLREAAGLGWTDAAYASELPRHTGYDRVVAITRSGTTTEVLAALDTIGGAATRVVVTGVPEAVGDRADEVIDLSWADERSVVQTRFPTTVLALLRAAIGDDLGPALHDLETVLAEDDDDAAANTADADHFVYLGHGWTVGLAHEAALKIREAAQAWAESYPALDYRHGPIAVAGARTLVRVLGAVPRDLDADVSAVGAHVMRTHHDPLAQLVAAQQHAVRLAARRGLSADQPRHLTRSVVLDGRHDRDAGGDAAMIPAKELS